MTGRHMVARARALLADRRRWIRKEGRGKPGENEASQGNGEQQWRNKKGSGPGDQRLNIIFLLGQKAGPWCFSVDLQMHF